MLRALQRPVQEGVALPAARRPAGVGPVAAVVVVMVVAVMVVAVMVVAAVAAVVQVAATLACRFRRNAAVRPRATGHCPVPA